AGTEGDVEAASERLRRVHCCLNSERTRGGLVVAGQHAVVVAAGDHRVAHSHPGAAASSAGAAAGRAATTAAATAAAAAAAATAPPAPAAAAAAPAAGKAAAGKGVAARGEAVRRTAHAAEAQETGVPGRRAILQHLAEIGTVGDVDRERVGTHHRED